jgi:tRNA-Thr(GGU) m(6)t(6)A37 methyltransferase TsaA
MDALLERLGLRSRPVPREPVSLRPIAVVRSNVAEPRPDGWEEIRSDLIFRDDLMSALDGIEAYSHVIVIFSCHQVPEEDPEAVRFRPHGDERLPEQGVLASRSQQRPNTLGVSVVPLLRRRRNILRVTGLDAIDGTPVLDVKPYLPHHDSVPQATVPDWALRPPLEPGEGSTPGEPSQASS